MSDHLILKGGTWHVRLDIPKDVQGHPLFLQKKVLTKSLKTGNRQIARDASREVLVDWKRRIREARERKGLLTWRFKAEATRDQYQRMVFEARTPADFDEAHVYRQVEIARLMSEYNLNEDQVNELVAITLRNETPKIQISPALIREFETYQARNFVIDKTASVQASNIKKIFAYLDSNNLRLEHNSVAQYLASLDASPKTKQNRLFAGNAFWNFLIHKDSSVKQTPNPFQKHEIQRPKRGKSRSNSYLAFSKQEIEMLHREAKTKGDQVLADTIKIAAYTGMRIEEICRLHKNNTQKDYFKIADAKTDAGNRDIPIHSNLSELVSQLIKNTNDGYLIESSAGNKYGNRSDSISKRFGRLKKNLGFQSNQVFHSIRKTTATLLEQSDAPPLVITAILGHRTNHITFDVYSQGPSLEQKRKALEKIAFDF